MFGKNRKGGEKPQGVIAPPLPGRPKLFSTPTTTTVLIGQPPMVLDPELEKIGHPLENHSKMGGEVELPCQQSPYCVVI